MHKAITQSHLLQSLTPLLSKLGFYFVNAPTMFDRQFKVPKASIPQAFQTLCSSLRYLAIFALVVWGSNALWHFFPSGNMAYL